MLELLVFPKKGERHPLSLFFVGLLYSSIAFLLVKFIFSKDVVLSSNSGMMIVMFTCLLSIIFFFFALRLDEKTNIRDRSEGMAMRDDWKVLKMLLYLFLGFIVGFLVWQLVFPGQVEFNSQMQTYCVINKPLQYQDCLDSYKIGDTLQNIPKGIKGNFLSIFSNNILVTIVLLFASLLFGAGVIFIIAWNASIIASVIAFSAQYNFSQIPLWFAKFMLHGIPEVAGYFLIAMAGGISSFAITSYFREKLSQESLMRVIRRALWLVIIGIILLAIAALIEVYVSSLI